MAATIYKWKFGSEDAAIIYAFGIWNLVSLLLAKLKWMDSITNGWMDVRLDGWIDGLLGTRK